MLESAKKVNIYDSIDMSLCDNGKYGYAEKKLIRRDEAKQCHASLYELPPGKSAYPYHYHVQTEESFYIVSGFGVIRTPEGDINVGKGDFIFFPANQKGCHQITNSSMSESLLYIDFDTQNPVDVVLYPDSGKIGVYGSGTDQVHRCDNKVDYYDGETD